MHIAVILNFNPERRFRTSAVCLYISAPICRNLSRVFFLCCSPVPTSALFSVFRLVNAHRSLSSSQGQAFQSALAHSVSLCPQTPYVKAYFFPLQLFPVMDIFNFSVVETQFSVIHKQNQLLPWAFSLQTFLTQLTFACLCPLDTNLESASPVLQLTEQVLTTCLEPYGICLLIWSFKEERWGSGKKLFPLKGKPIEINSKRMLEL